MVEVTAEFLTEKIVIDVFDKNVLAFRREFQFAPITIGRDAENALMLPYAAVSRNHCVIYKMDDRWFIHDAGSRNGISIGGQREETIELTADCEVKIASIKIRVQILPASQAMDEE